MAIPKDILAACDAIVVAPTDSTRRHCAQQLFRLLGKQQQQETGPPQTENEVTSNPTSRTIDASTARPFWSSLPPEIRLLILRCIILKRGLLETIPDRGFPKVSSLATVSREWQNFFERETFCRMALVPSDLLAFSKVVRGNNCRRLDYITRLRLHVKLVEYTERSSDKLESAVTVNQNNWTFTYAMAVLLQVLSSWEGVYGGLTLEINAHSPSDQKYHPFYLEVHDDHPIRFEEDLNRFSELLEYYKKKKEERRDSAVVRRNVAVREGMAQRLSGTPLELQSWLIKRQRSGEKTRRNLPSVPIVKGLCLRPEFFRGVAFTSLAELFRQSFVALKSFRLQRWVSGKGEEDVDFMNGFQTYLLPALPASIERFSFYWASNGKSVVNGRQTTLIFNEQLPKCMATSCHRFRMLSPPHSICATRFLEQVVIGGRRGESKLQHLSLRVERFHPCWQQERVTDFLCLAGRASKNMPLLQTLELWNCGRGFAFIFRYTQDESRATITWRSVGGDFHLAPEALNTWTEVAKLRTLSLVVKRIPIRVENDGKFYVIRHLALRMLAFDPVTQARRFLENIT